MENVTKLNMWDVDAHLEVGDGWAGLCRQMVLAVEDRMQEMGHKIKWLQIKQKFGGLRVYYNVVGGEDMARERYDAVTEGIGRIIDAYTIVLSNTCEGCGSFGVEGVDGGWISVKCKACAKKEKEQ